MDASDSQGKRTNGRVAADKKPSSKPTPSNRPGEGSIAAQLIAVSFGGQVLGRRIHAVSSDNWRR